VAFLLVPSAPYLNPSSLPEAWISSVSVGSIPIPTRPVNLLSPTPPATTEPNEPVEVAEPLMTPFAF